MSDEPTQVERLQTLIARATTNTAFLEVLLGEAKLKEAEEAGLTEIDGVSIDNYKFKMRLDLSFYHELCRRNNLPPHR